VETVQRKIRSIICFLRVLETLNFKDPLFYAKVPDVNLYTLFTGLWRS